MLDKLFLIGLRNRNLHPGIHAYPIWLIISSCNFIRNRWDAAYRDYGLRLYSKWLGVHYGPTGRGYFNYEVLTDKEKLAQYGDSRGRLKYFLKNNLRVLGYEDGQSFLDAGCGIGQNIKVLTECFPNSPIRAFDISESALDVVGLGVKDKKKIQVEPGSLTDVDYLDQYPANGFDHILVSHVFSFIMAEDELATRELRQLIIDELVRIGRNTILILDGPGIMNLETPTFRIEQLYRAHYSESIISYFEKYREYGEIYALFSTESVGVLFINK